MKPTPGPWEVESDSHQVDGIGRVRLYRVVAPNGDTVAEFSNAGCNEILYEDDPDYGGEHYDLQAMANAELIARAPELADENAKLRAALQAIIDASPPDTAYSWGLTHLRECHQIASAALGQNATP